MVLEEIENQTQLDRREQNALEPMVLKTQPYSRTIQPSSLTSGWRQKNRAWLHGFISWGDP